MRPRVLIFDDDELIRSLLWRVFDSRGYEVFTYQDPAACPLHVAKGCACKQKVACTDVLISDLDMPKVNGLDFVESQAAKGCLCKHIALISGGWSNESLLRAGKLGCKVFEKPFSIDQLTAWLDEIEKEIDPDRELSNWHVQRLPSN